MRTFSKTSSQSSLAHHQPHHGAWPSITLTSVAAATPAYNSKSKATTSPERTAKCATVTMMLAERIIRNDWSVEDEHFFDSNNMNVWQTLEFLSGVNSRKRYNYEGYNDANNAIRTLTPSWRRDSFVEKNVNPNGDESNSGPNGKYSTVANSTSETNDHLVNNNAGAVDVNGLRGGSAGRGGGAAGISRNHRSSFSHSKASKYAKASHRRRRDKQKLQANELDPEYALSPADYSDLIKCTFNLPRISAALERLMGTNVVRLTDRNYMKELRERIEDDYRANLQKRIKARELKEVERERILIIEGKTNVIPAELADDPIFVVDKKADLEILKSRAKLKTNREKNSDRLKLQGVKWERERLQHEEEEAQRINVLRQRYKEQKALEEQYKDEDANKGMDLLRIDNEEWRPCEQQLKEFLEQERAKMKERSLRMPTPFATDPKDINNILKARKAFREVERRIRKAIEEKHEENLKQKHLPHQLSGQQQPTGFGILEQSQEQIIQKALEELPATKDPFETEDVVDTAVVRKNLTSDDASDISSGESLDEGSSISLAKQRYAHMLQQELENDVSEGLLISKEQYDHLRYEDDKIMQLRNARDIRELYQLAEEIIIGERVESYAEEEEALAEEEEVENEEPEIPEQE
ncbi:centrosome-associated protein CEP250 isoform X1 [Lucilia cuprina]|uniref:centrosome-associated protein CEP250 isoform X1 n=1 Tax=Lucilia cuprina TaxID=7375 RepID=UPI001F067B71|nr:centrosome-associated protein CEP250 isoform X1 [Lucilia cuprina]